MLHYTVLHYNTLHILTSSSLLLNMAFGYQSLSSFQTISMELISGEIPGHFRMDIPLHSRNVLVLFEHGVAQDLA